MGEKYLCLECEADLPYTRYSLRMRNPMADKFNGQIQKHLKEFESYSYASALYFYHEGYKEISKGLKYEGRLALGREFGRRLGQDLAASSLFKDVDAVVLVVDASSHYGAGDEFINKSLPKDTNLFVVINKIDLIKLPQAEQVKELFKTNYPNAKIIEMSAIENFGIDTLLNDIKQILPEGPRYYPEDAVSDKDSAFFISEVIREKLLTLLKEEVPHDLAVRVDEIENKNKECFIKATIIVDKESHKGIVIGKGGKRIKAIGMKSRSDLEEYFGKHIFLELFVSVKEDWLNNPRILKELGYK